MLVKMLKIMDGPLAKNTKYFHFILIAVYVDIMYICIYKPVDS